MIVAKASHLSRRQRRVLVLVEYAGLFSMPVAAILMGNSWWSLLSLLGLGAAMLVHRRLLVPFTQEIADKRDADLDERQTAVRDSAHRTAYQILGTLLLGALFLLWVMIEPLGERPWMPKLSIQNPIVVYMTTFWVYVTLPTSVIAWREPDPEPGD
jgi:hypothetical protein